MSPLACRRAALASRRFTRNWKLLGLRARSSGTAARVRRLPVGEQKSAGSAYEATNRARGLFENLVSFDARRRRSFLIQPKAAISSCQML
jgi:hypothetical protein